tara:strand:+ start:126 stop:320 length:195 start_codon:yes stop_codon:yes gene_type:complete
MDKRILKLVNVPGRVYDKDDHLEAQIEHLKGEVKCLKLQVAEEVKEKYALYKRIKRLTDSKDSV